MVATDRTRFAEMLAGLASVFNRELDRPTIELYFRALADLPVQDVAAGCQDCLRNLVFFPKPSEIRERAYGGEGEAEHTTPARVALPEHHTPGMREVCIETWKRWGEGRLTLAGLCDWMRLMDRDYPGLGWGEEAEKLAPTIARAGALNGRFVPKWWGDVVEVGRTPLGDPIVRPKDARGAVSQIRKITLDVLNGAAKRDMAAEQRELATVGREEGVPF